MELSTFTLINYQTLLISISVIILSIVDFYFTGHALETFAAYFPPGNYDWHYPGSGYVWPRPAGRQVRLKYDTSPETMILASTSFSILAGTLGIAAFFIANKKPQLPTVLSIATLTTSTAAFLASFVSIIVSSVKYETLANTTCRWSEALASNPVLTCTRELVACELVNFLTLDNSADNRRVCRETKGARVILVPLTVLTFVLGALYALRIWMSRAGKSAWESAEERVAGLQRGG